MKEWEAKTNMKDDMLEVYMYDDKNPVIEKNRSVGIIRRPPGPVCHNQKENSFSQFVRISSDFSHFCQLKGALQ